MNCATGNCLLTAGSKKVTYAGSPVRHLSLDIFWNDREDAFPVIVGPAQHLDADFLTCLAKEALVHVVSVVFPVAIIDICVLEL